MFTLYYLADTISQAEIDQYADTIEQLKNGEFKSLLFEKLKGYNNIYSVRDNYKGRLLISFPLINGKRVLVILEVLPHHGYEKSRVLRSAIIRQYIADVEQINAAQPFAALDDFTEVKQVLSTVSTSSSSYSQKKPVHYYFSALVEHSASQEAAIKQAYPQLIIGPSGTGKSCVAVAKIRKLSETLAACEHPGTITYIAPNRVLCRQVQETFEATLAAISKVKIDFLTYEEWLRIADKPIVRFEDFSKWLLQHPFNSQPEIKNLVKSPKNSQAHIKKIYAELQIIAVHTLEAYLDLGERESQFKKGKIREELCNLFANYCAYLKNKKACDPALNVQAFFSMDKEAGAHYVLIDEAQSISAVVLQLLIQHYGDNSCLFADPNQNTETPISVLPLIKKWLMQKSTQPAIVELEICFRCPPAVIKTANWVLALKNHLNQGVSDKLETAKVQCSETAQERGQVYVKKLHEEEIANLNTQLAVHKLQYAVITHQDFVTAAKKVFPGVLVFTVAEIRGLQFKYIIAYRLFDTKEMKSLNDKLRELEKNGASFHPDRIALYANLPKSTAERENRFNMVLNELFVAFTRSMKSLWIFEDYDQHHYQYTATSLFSYLNPQPVSAIANLSEATSFSLDTVYDDTPVDYMEIVNQLLGNGNEEQAEQVFVEYSHKSKAEFLQIKSFFNVTEIAASSSLHSTSLHQSSSGDSSYPSQSSSSTELTKDNQPGRKSRSKRSKYLPVNSQIPNVLVKQSEQKAKGKQMLFKVDGLSLCELATSPEGCTHLAKLSEKQIQALDVAVFYAIDPVLKVSILSWLAANPEGRTVLIRLSEAQIQALAMSAFCAINPIHKVPALYWLAANPEGRAMLTKLSAEQIQALEVAALCAIYPAHKVPALFWLAAYPEGYTVLAKLSETQIQALNIAALCAIHFEGGESALYWLTAYPERCTVLPKLSAGQIQALEIAALCAIYPTHKVSALYRLATNLEGRTMLAKLSEAQIQALEIAALCAIHPDHKLPVLYWLAVYPEGSTVLTKLSAEQIQALEIAALCAIHPLIEVPVLYWLAVFAEGHAVLAQLSKKQIKAMHIATLCAIHPDEKVPALYWLAGSPEGLSVLAKLSKQQIQAIAPDTIFSNYCSGVGDCVFGTLIKTEVGLKVLTRFLEHNLQLVKRLADECLPQSAGNNLPEIYLSIFQKTEAGKAILDKVNKQKPNIPLTTFFPYNANNQSDAESNTELDPNSGSSSQMKFS